jgi:2-polyprenyl-3-methyl-5-hydroxy-6-metoxy-1,4-benzoquinol methylase
MNSDLDNRSLSEIYTPRNIWNEIKLRLSTVEYRRNPRHTGPKTTARYDDRHARSVGQFYDTHHDKFLKAYGEVIQAFRTKDVADLLNYQIKSIGFQPGQRALDAGCGIGVPAIHFARHAHVHIDAITISKIQHDAARAKVDAANLSEQIEVVHGDYHKLAHYFTPGSYDVVYFLESFGHSTAKGHLIDACWEMLKPGGILYIKDLFRRLAARAEHQEPIDREIRKINEAYRYDVADLNTVLDDLRRKGFILVSLKTIDLELDQFEDLAISNEFQELTGLARIENWNEYVFPVDFFEVRCVKPEFSLDERLDRYFLQNRYHRHEDGRAADGGD